MTAQTHISKLLITSQEAKSLPTPKAAGAWAWEGLGEVPTLVRKDYSEERDQRGLVTCLRPQSKSRGKEQGGGGANTGRKTVSTLLNTRGSCKCSWKPPPSGPLHQGERQMLCPLSGCYSGSGHSIYQPLGWGWLWTVMLERSPSRPQLWSQPCMEGRGGEGRRSLECPGSPQPFTWPPLPGARQTPSTEPARSV